MNMKAFQDKKVILFDWNRTLVDTNAAFDTAFIEVIKQYTDRWDPPEDWDPQTVLHKYKSAWKQQRQKMSYERAAVTSLGKALQQLPFPKDRDQLSTLHRLIRKEQHSYSQPVPGAVDVLKKLSRTHTLAVVSNSERVNLRQAGLSEWISPDLCFTASAASNRKPNPDLFLQAISKIKIPPSDCLMVGNSWRTDIRGAQRAGIDAVWIRKQGKKSLTLRR
jgi:HAD superfamily hydrolase (TIGR01509 family)